MLFGISLDFISFYFETYWGMLQLIPLVFLITQVFVYHNLLIIERSYLYKLSDLLNNEEMWFLSILYMVGTQFSWTGLTTTIITHPYIFAWLIYIFGLMVILSVLNLISVRKFNKQLFVRKLSDD